MKKKTVEYGKYGYFFILPFFLVFFVFQLYPLIYTFYLSFVEYYQIKLGKFQGGAEQIVQNDSSANFIWSK